MFGAYRSYLLRYKKYYTICIALTRNKYTSVVYQDVLHRERLTLIDGLIRGETSKARQGLKQMTGNVSMIRRLLAIFSGGMTKRILELRRMVKS